MATMRKIQKRGRALQLNLPQEVLNHLDLRFGDNVLFVVANETWCAFTKVDLHSLPELRRFGIEELPEFQQGEY
jgi:antitoxin component of MazEF toxin-antitoxin module